MPIIHVAESYVQELAEMVNSLREQRDRVVRLTAILAHSEGAEYGNSFPDDRSAVAWACEGDVLESDLDLWSNTERTTDWPEWDWDKLSTKPNQYPDFPALPTKQQG